MDWQFIKRALELFVARACQQNRFWCVVLNGKVKALFILENERHRHRNFKPLARGQEGVAKDAIDPCPEISSQLKGREPFKGLNVGFLNQIFSFLAILSEPVSEVVKPVEEGKRQFFERAELEVRS